MTHRLFIVLTYDKELLEGAYTDTGLRQLRDDGTVIISVSLGETIALIPQSSLRKNNERVMKVIKEWLADSPDGLIAITYHNRYLTPWEGLNLLPFVPFSHEVYDPVYGYTLLPFKEGSISFHEAWCRLGRKGGLIEKLKAELIVPFIPSHFFAQSQSNNPVEWQDIFIESQKRLQQIKTGNTLQKLLTFASNDFDCAQSNLVQSFADLSRRLTTCSLSNQSAIEIKDHAEKFTEALENFLGESYPEMKPDPIAVFRHSIDNALNYLSPYLCVFTPTGQPEELLNNAARDLSDFGEDFIHVRVQHLQRIKDLLDKQRFDQIFNSLENATHVYDRLLDNLKTGTRDHGFWNDIRTGVQSLNNSFKQVSGLLRQDK